MEYVHGSTQLPTSETQQKCPVRSPCGNLVFSTHRRVKVLSAGRFEAVSAVPMPLSRGARVDLVMLT
jgi:hypothetical protein